MPPDDPPSLAAEGLKRSFGHVHAVRGVDLRVGRGALLAVVGPNGAGKTTLLRMLGGLARPSAGWVTVMGRALRPDAPDARRPLGLLSHQSFLYDDLGALENLRFAARLYRLPEPAARAARALETVGLAGDGNRPVRTLSRGMVQRVALARTLLTDPEILLLDEPFTGLDAPAGERLRVFLRAHLGRGGSAVVVSHQLAEVWDLASEVAVMVGGRWAEPPASAPPLEEFHRRYAELLRG